MSIKVLVDANILIYLEKVGALDLIVKMDEHDFIISEAILTELHQKPITQKLSSMIDTGTIQVLSAPYSLASHRKLHLLDIGERELIAIVSNCEDRTYKNYLIITYDIKARKVIKDIRMKVQNIFEFLIWCNASNRLSIERAMYLYRLLFQLLNPREKLSSEKEIKFRNKLVYIA